MYTMVLMMAVTSGGEVSSFGHRNKGCNGDVASCHGAVVVAAPAGCNGSYATVGYADAAGCNGGGACHGAKKGFLGGLFGHHHKKSSCHGAVVAAPDCGGCAPVVAPDCGGCPPVVAAPVTGGTTPPVIMPKVEDPKPKPKTEDKPKDKTESN